MAPDAFPGLSANWLNVRLDSKPAAEVGNVLLVNAFADLALGLEAQKDI
jgi:Transposase DDE domain group 1